MPTDAGSQGPLAVKLDVDSGCVGKLTVEGLAIAEAAAEKLRPGRDLDVIGDGLGQQSP
jgi:hypothetical protein